MLLLNNIVWLFACYGFFRIREAIVMNDQGLNDFKLGNDFIPSNYDMAFAMWVFGSLAIYFWTKFSLYFFSGWERFRTSPAQLWVIKNFGIWGYALLGLLILPDLLLLPAIPGIYMLETIKVHVGDFVMPPIFSFLSIIIDFFAKN